MKKMVFMATKKIFYESIIYLQVSFKKSPTFWRGIHTNTHSFIWRSL